MLKIDEEDMRKIAFLPTKYDDNFIKAASKLWSHIATALFSVCKHAEVDEFYSAMVYRYFSYYIGIKLRAANQSYQNYLAEQAEQNPLLKEFLELEQYLVHLENTPRDKDEVDRNTELKRTREQLDSIKKTLQDPANKKNRPLFFKQKMFEMAENSDQPINPNRERGLFKLTMIRAKIFEAQHGVVPPVNQATFKEGELTCPLKAKP